MNTPAMEQFIFLGGLFATVTTLAFALSGLVMKRTRTSLAMRLRERSSTPLNEPEEQTEHPGAFRKLIFRVGDNAGQAFMPKKAEKQTALRRALTQAGIYSAAAMQRFVGLKVLFLALGALVGYILFSASDDYSGWIGLYIGALAGYFLPTLWLRSKVGARQKGLEKALPDALDLMVVCVEAGLTLDAAIQRVGQEIAMAHPEIAREFGITHMETRIGVPRVDALKNLALRTGSAAMQSLAAMLVQTEKFGTSVAQALRVHAESLRTKRTYKAEEAAAKTTVKLAFPVVLFIFPTLVVVLGGPAFILFLRSPLFNK